jgi:hypothetical protein
VTKYNFNKKMSRSQISWEKYKDRLIEEEREWLHGLAEHFGVDPDAEDLAERLGLEGSKKTLEQKFKEFEIVRSGWVMKKTKKGNVFVSIGEVKGRPQTINHKEYNYGRIQMSVDPQWIGYTAMVVVSKNKTPKRKYHFDDEISIEDLAHTDPSNLVDIIFESKSDRNKGNNSKLKKEPEESSTKEEVQALKERIERIYKFTHDKFDPIMEIYNAMLETPEGKVARDKALEAIMDKWQAESREVQP